MASVGVDKARLTVTSLLLGALVALIPVPSPSYSDRSTRLRLIMATVLLLLATALGGGT
jgi:hypothetical protein